MKISISVLLFSAFLMAQDFYSMEEGHVLLDNGKVSRNIRISGGAGFPLQKMAGTRRKLGESETFHLFIQRNRQWFVQNVNQEPGNLHSRDNPDFHTSCFGASWILP